MLFNPNQSPAYGFPGPMSYFTPPLPQSQYYPSLPQTGVSQSLSSSVSPSAAGIFQASEAIHLPEHLQSSTSVATSQFLTDQNWFVDSGATNHMTADTHNLLVKSNYQGGILVQVGNGQSVPITHTDCDFADLTDAYVTGDSWRLPSCSSKSVTSTSTDNSSTAVDSASTTANTHSIPLVTPQLLHHKIFQ
ncbi:uncharacterized protein LOC116136329 [Pistacia vera]|uniref:uncharacterized protein LOC116136329 n=1 Tax=Pistacia vera TaxID=55513 RepID=UPI001262E73A|nr:uncharacterized protein LOC116136329 [Pistacia vera]